MEILFDLLGPVLSNGGHGGAIAERRGSFLKNCHRIAVAWRVANDDGHSHGGHGSYGGMAEIAFYFLFFFHGRSWADLTQLYPVS